MFDYPGQPLVNLFVRLGEEAARPVVISVMPSHSIRVTGVPTEPLPATPAQQTITVQPTLAAGSMFTPAQTLNVTLSCPGLDLSGEGLLAFTGTGSAEIVAQSLTFTPPPVVAGAGQIWSCSWSLGGSTPIASRLPPPSP